jgi:hypothetical protein
MASNEVQVIRYDEASEPAGGWHIVDAVKRAALVSSVIIAVVAVLALVVVSPLALRQLGSLGKENWTQLSDIGQTYGVASALLTGLALIGVVGSMVFQVRAIRVSREQSSREHHTHLVEMALADPAYQQCWGGAPAKYGTPDGYRQQVYLNLIVSNWQKDYNLGGFRDHALRLASAHLFCGEAGRKFWATSRDIRLKVSESRRDRRFWRIMEQEYQKAIAAGPPTVPADASPVALPASQGDMFRDSAIKAGITLLLGAIGGITFGSLMRQRKL